MEEQQPTQAEISHKFFEEYKVLREKYHRDFAFDAQIHIVEWKIEEPKKQ